MNGKEINIIDIRKYCGSQSEIVDYEEDEVIFAKEYQHNNKNYSSLNSYKVSTDIAKEIYHYEIPSEEYHNQFFRVVEQEILVIKMHQVNIIEIDVIDKKSKKIKSRHSFQIDEEITSIPIAINNRYFIFYADIDEMDSLQYAEYNEKGYDHFIYLCDLVENEIYLIKDLRLVNGLSVVHGLLDYLPVFSHNNQEYLIFNETYMSDYEYEEDIYQGIKAGNIDKEEIKEIEALYTISVKDFVEAIKASQPNIPFKEISKRMLNGWVRYTGMIDGNIYFREKDFETQIEKIYAINKVNLESAIVKEIDHKKVRGRLFYSDIIYEQIEVANRVEIKGLFNCNYEVSFKNEKNIWFETFINDRYLVTTQWMEDEEDNYFEFVYVTEVRDKKRMKYDGTCKSYNNNLIIYTT